MCWLDVTLGRQRHHAAPKGKKRIRITSLTLRANPPGVCNFQGNSIRMIFCCYLEGGCSLFTEKQHS